MVGLMDPCYGINPALVGGGWILRSSIGHMDIDHITFDSRKVDLTAPKSSSPAHVAVVGRENV